jgi:hypothetical protein
LPFDLWSQRPVKQAGDSQTPFRVR